MTFIVAGIALGAAAGSEAGDNDWFTALGLFVAGLALTSYGVGLL